MIGEYQIVWAATSTQSHLFSAFEYERSKMHTMPMGRMPHMASHVPMDNRVVRPNLPIPPAHTYYQKPQPAPNTYYGYFSQSQGPITPGIPGIPGMSLPFSQSQTDRGLTGFSQVCPVVLQLIFFTGELPRGFQILITSIEWNPFLSCCDCLFHLFVML